MIDTERPWMRALEAQVTTLKVYRKTLASETLTDRDRKWTHWWIHLLSTAQTYAWADNCTEAVRRASQTIFGDTELREAQFLAGSGWWWFENGLRVFAPNHHEIVAVAWGTKEPGYVEFTAFRKSDWQDVAPVPGITFSWPLDWSIDRLIATTESLDPVEVQGSRESMRDVARFVLAANTWLEHRLVTTSSGPVERHRRKQLAREYNAPIVAEVKIIQLRRTEARELTSSDKAFEYSYGSIVNAHWKRQFYPSTGLRKLIPIGPYIRCADKPLKPPTETVYSISR